LLAPNGFIAVQISSLVSDTRWIKIANELTVDVTTQKDMPEHVNTINYGQCGGTGEIRRFPSMNFSTDFDTYTIRPTYPDADFFTLQPGEFEEFVIPFECKSIGIYYFTINVSYEISNISGVSDSDKTVGFMCPQTYTAWGFDPFVHQFLSSITYQWNGNGYEEIP
jgi:hypothetical protein